MGLLTKNLKPWHLVIIGALIVIFIVAPLTLYTAMKFTILHRHSKYTRAHNEEVKRFNQAQQRLNIIKEALGSMVFYEHSPKLYAFEADTEDFDYQSISFVSRVPPNFPGSKKFAGQRTRRIQFIVEDGKEGERELVMYQTPLLQPRNEYMLDESHRHIILGNLNTFMCMLWSSTENDWIYHWEDKDTVPTRIKIELAQNKPDGSTAMAEDILAINIPTKIANITQTMQNPPLPAARRAPSSRGPGRAPARNPASAEQIAAWRKKREEDARRRERENDGKRKFPDGRWVSGYGMLGNTAKRYDANGDGILDSGERAKWWADRAASNKNSQSSGGSRAAGPVAPSLPPGMVTGELGMLLYEGNGGSSSRGSTTSRRSSSVYSGSTGLVSGELGMLLYKGP